MNEHSVTEQPGEANVSSVPRHDLDDYSSGGMRGIGPIPDALHSARSRIRVKIDQRAQTIKRGGTIRIRRSES